MACRWLLCVATLARAVLGIADRDYAPGSWTASFYRPREVHIESVGIVNEHMVFFATKLGVSALHEGLLTPLVEAADADIKSFHLCHHRSSIFYEILAKDGGVLTIYEYSLSARESVKIRVFQETVPATSLACVDQLLLRASPANLIAISLQQGGFGHTSVLQKFRDPEGADALGSLSVGFAADVPSQAQLFAVAPRNRSVLRLHLVEDETTGGLHLGGSELLVAGGDGGDGPLSEASALEPRQVLWNHGKVLFSDGCSVRQIDGGLVTTLLGAPAECVEPGNETLAPVPWATRISAPAALAAEAEGTAGAAVLVLTAAQVVHISHREDDACAAHVPAGEDACISSGCGWAEGTGPNQRLCFGCEGLQEWAEAQRPHVDACSLELGSNAADTRYSLFGCGCVAPPKPSPTPVPSSGETSVLQVFLSLVVFGAGSVAAVFMYRAYRRAAVMRELYGVDTAEFHTFHDDECLH